MYRVGVDRDLNVRGFEHHQAVPGDHDPLCRKHRNNDGVLAARRGDCDRDMSSSWIVAREGMKSDSENYQMRTAQSAAP
jgi:hypothetical protein